MIHITNFNITTNSYKINFSNTLNKAYYEESENHQDREAVLNLDSYSFSSEFLEWLS